MGPYAKRRSWLYLWTFFSSRRGRALQTDFGESTIGIIVTNLDNSRKYSFRLKEKTTIQMLEVLPGNYRIDLVEYLSSETMPVTENFYMEGYQNDFVVGANTAVYMGDFSGTAERGYNKFAWILDQTANNYNATTLDVRDFFCFYKK